MNEVNFSIAFLAGIISFLSPCVFPLVPVYLAQLTGGNLADDGLQAEASAVLWRSIGFVAGFSIVFILLGASSTLLGKFFLAYRSWIEIIGGLIIIIFGLQMTGILSITLLMREKRAQLTGTIGQSKSFLRSVIMGFAFGAGWTPCIGLVLSSILILASQSDTMWEGMLLLLVYSMGLGVPFLLIATIWSRSLQRLQRINKALPAIQKISGGLLVLLGILLMTGLFKRISFYFS